MSTCRRLLLVLLLGLHLGPALAQSGPPELPHARVGDVILLPLRCMLCSAIATETDSEYSHSGVLIRSPQGEWAVAQALGSVNKVSVRGFLQNVPPGKRPGVFRHWSLERRPGRAARLWTLFQSEYAGLSFDHLFLWGNRDAQGHELFYCSEFVAKFLNRVLPRPVLPVPMEFSRNAAFWEKFFASHGGTVPQGLPGMAPADLERSADFAPVEGP